MSGIDAMTSRQPRPSFSQMLTSERFHYGIELVSSRGLPEAPGTPGKLTATARAMAEDPHFSWVSVTDNPGGNPMLPADFLARKLAQWDAEVVIHLSCKDLNRNGLESAAWRCAAEGFSNLLALTGDYPVAGFGGAADPVFDLDSVALIALLKAMNDGLEIPGRTGATETLPGAGFFIGAAVSPFKRHERELMPQLLKLLRKIRCGARWIIPQLGYDMRKLQELKLFLQWAKVDVPLVGNVYLLTRTVADIFNRNRIPGCVVSDELNQTIQRHASGPDKGRSFFRELAARQLAVLKGLGYQAGYLAGTAKPSTMAEVIDLAESFAPDDWKCFAKELQYPQPGEFYLFERDPDTGLSDPNQMNREYLASLKHPPRTDNVTVGYRLTRKIHGAAFTRGKGQFSRIAGLYQALEKHNGATKAIVAGALHTIERSGKELLFGCKDCGDCSLPDCAYLCPRAACSKSGRNGPCGGSRDGRCELDDKQCIWARAYDRMKFYGESQQMLDGEPVIYNPELAGTSAWANTFLGRDHHAPGEAQPDPLIPAPQPTRREK